ncbi:MAG: tyrosine--tRNA ligase [Patescibacteria group bacterium]|nr:MAG: tyrosine--tRNA ligase [Patescibacteria group bacterium]
MKSDANTIEELFSRGVGEFIDPGGVFKEKLLKKSKGEYSNDIIIKFGIDPTQPDIHLGHAAVFRKLRQFQDLGCKVVFLVGDFTANIGDPTGKNKVRPSIEQKEIEANMATYLKQVGKILQTDEEVFSWIKNSDWFYSVSDLMVEEKSVRIQGKDEKGNDSSIQVSANSHIGKAALYSATRMQKTHLKKEEMHDITLRGLLWTLGHITHARLIERDMFQERIKKGEELYMHEMLYPILQGIDSLFIAKIYGSCDLEIGGTDQVFNMLMGRDVMKINKREQQSVLSIKLLEGTDGKEKMSKSLGNYIAITDEPNDMYGKVMSVPDASIMNYFELCTYTPRSEIEKMKNIIEKGGTNLRDKKMELARRIVALYHGEEQAQKAQKDFIAAFQKGGVPEEIEEVAAEKKEKLSDILLKNGFVRSKTEFRRLIKEGAIKFADGSKVEDEHYALEEDGVFKVGKKRFVRIVV